MLHTGKVKERHREKHALFSISLCFFRGSHSSSLLVLLTAGPPLPLLVVYFVWPCMQKTDDSKIGCHRGLMDVFRPGCDSLVKRIDLFVDPFVN